MSRSRIPINEAVLFCILAFAVPSQAQFPILVLDGDDAGDHFGTSVAGAGDVNGDGVADFIVGAPTDELNGNNSGTVRVYSGADNTIIHTFIGNSGGDRLGDSVSGVGDVNADGFDDIVAGAYRDDMNGTSSGSAYVYSGFDGSILYSFHGDSAADFLGFSVSKAGDVNNDGVPDILVGAYGDDNAGVDSGSARIYSGANGNILYTLNGGAPGDAFGFSVSDAGDTNNDGFADVIVGAPLADISGPSSGSAFIISGANGISLGDFHGNSAGDEFGHSVSGAGDVNGDGFEDVIVGAYLDDTAGTNAGRMDIFSVMSQSIIYAILGKKAGDQFGIAVSDAGDANGDGLADVLVGANQSDEYGGNTGSAYLFGGHNGVELWKFIGDASGDRLGEALACVGDLTGDGLPEAIVGSHLHDTNGAQSGRIHIESNLDNPYAYQFEGDLADDYLGGSVSSAGDVNGDGFDDVIVGAIGADPNGSTSGLARVYSGIDGSTLYTFHGDLFNSRLGNSVAGGGDLNGDGFDDLLVSVGVNTGPSGYMPAVRVFSGIDGSKLYDYFPTTVCVFINALVVGNAGDVNGDGFDDILVSNPFDCATFSDSGIVQVVSGVNGTLLYSYSGTVQYQREGISLDTIGDVDGDGCSEFIIGTEKNFARVYNGIDGTLRYSIAGGYIADNFGFSVSGVGDFNGDQIPDFAIGAPEKDTILANAGSVTVYSGTDASVLFHLEGRDAFEGLGQDVRRAGDVNGDGYGDLLVSSDRQAGKTVQVYLGPDGKVGSTYRGGEAAENFASSIDSAGDINGDGYDDIIIGAEYDDANGANSGSARVYFGDGPPVPSLEYRSNLGFIKLELNWFGDNNDVYSTTGSISCRGATPGALGVNGVSLAPTNTLIFGFPLLIANDPINLIGTGGFGFDVSGEINAHNISRQSPQLAGTYVFIQFFETSPQPSASNGLALLLVP
ncbi:MAG: hypothetical protein ACI97A_003819 [Planctomycetota bacterium]|jgi:hypothetical protein